MATWPLTLRRASEDDLDVVVGLVREASVWLQRKGTDQWARPWPSRRGRDSRIIGHLRTKRTWIAWDGDVAAATISADTNPDPHWPESELRESALYLHRLVVSRPYGGKRLGAELIDWAGRAARRDHGALWIRVNAWSTNYGLHAYYLKEGFEYCGHCIDDGYPSGALFQKSTDLGMPAGPLPFWEEPLGR